ncbi:efflux MFS transporter YdeE [Xenorhabdus sp. 12]|uniref:Efflux MFS transporter YdeE n=1 Tax=Xenorhabdus santafensis TaxID=2582833 RepID=A0ABU4S603_9GAMM|nr:efflux MFS transporter YdeE [Xenorhabdus sp. 12]MDX7986522.1 efflux MFS transporter YdeE [Xenorhabdus sp. 12]
MPSKSKTSIIALLSSSLLLTIGRGATIPFMAIYLSREYDMPVDQVGFALTAALSFGVLFSIGFGILSDRLDKKRCMLLAIIVFICGFITIPQVNSASLVVVFLSLINCSYTVFSTVLKAYFADTLPASAKTKVFSMNYTCTNIGWTIGPPLGTWLMVYSMNLPFLLAAVSAALPIVFIQYYVQNRRIADGDSKSSAWKPSVMLHDRVLAWFILSAFLGSLVFGAFASCISQYVLTIADGSLAKSVVGVVLPINAAIVVSLQYMVGRRIRPDNIKALMTLGTLFFLLGLGGFILAGSNLIIWGIAVAIFTLGELIYAPGEYMLIDNIAPDGMKASYFSAQTLGWLGGAFNPMFSGVILTHLPPYSLFMIMMGISVLAWLCMLRGMKIRNARVKLF